MLKAENKISSGFVNRDAILNRPTASMESCRSQDRLEQKNGAKFASR